MVDRLLVIAAAIWKARADLIELAGLGCLVYAAALWLTPVAWLVLGLGLVLKAFEIDRSSE